MYQTIIHIAFYVSVATSGVFGLPSPTGPTPFLSTPGIPASTLLSHAIAPRDPAVLLPRPLDGPSLPRERRPMQPRYMNADYGANATQTTQPAIQKRDTAPTFLPHARLPSSCNAESCLKHLERNTDLASAREREHEAAQLRARSDAIQSTDAHAENLNDHGSYTAIAPPHDTPVTSNLASIHARRRARAIRSHIIARKGYD